MSSNSYTVDLTRTILYSVQNSKSCGELPKVQDGFGNVTGCSHRRYVGYSGTYQHGRRRGK